MSRLIVNQIQGDAVTKNIEIPAEHVLYAPGHVIQVVGNSSTTSASTTSTSSYTDGTPTVTITPKSSSSKIVMICSVSAESSGSGTDRGIRLRLLRDSTVIQTQTYNLYMSSNNNQRISQVTMHHYDSPATTSAVTYKFQFNPTGSSSTARVNHYGASNITVMEIAQ